MTPARWILPQSDAQAAGSLASELAIGLPAARVLCARGLSVTADARRFLNPSLDDLHDPMLMAGMADGVERLRVAIARGESVLICGDYDVDGTTSVVVLKKAIEMAGGKVDFHVPHRLKDGYGMHTEVIERAAGDGVRLVISVDTGIRAGDVVQRAAELGIDVIVTDHHLPEAELPPAVAVLNPNRRDCGYPEKNLCGAGVTFKLVQALLGSLSWPPEKLRRVCQSFLKLVALATVADVVPLTGENRIIVKHGLAGLADVRNPGLRALLDVAGFGGPALPTATQVAFRIAPRINAAGRMATATEVIEMFLTADAERARTIADRLHAWNAERQQTEMEIVETILSECEQAPVGDDQAGLVFCGAGWHRGVLGIVASRLVDRFHRPVVVLGEEGGIAQGSGRSIPQFHLLNALEVMPELFLRFGGHAAAAGLTLGAENVARFRDRFNQFALSTLTAADFVPVVEIDAVLNLAELTDRSVAGVLSLAPFGCGNPAPLFAALDVEIAGPPAIWAEKHVRVALRHNGRTVVAKAWGFAERLPELAPGSRADVALTIEDDAYSAARGYPGWCLVIRDIRPAAASAAA